MIHSDGTELFLNGRKSSNVWQNMDDKVHEELYIKYYTGDIILSMCNFEHDVFFDFYQGFMKVKI